MELFLDNDIILKLSSAGLLNKIGNIFNSPSSSIYILSTAIPYISNSKRVIKKYGKTTIKESLKIIANYQIIPDSYIDKKKFIELSRIDGIDSGEQLLYSVTPSALDFLILTGDKVSITALSNSYNIKGILTFLTNKIICLEQIILNLIKSDGFAVIKNKIKESNFFANDKTIKICFNQPNADEEKVKKCLLSYINNLKQEAKNLF